MYNFVFECVLVIFRFFVFHAKSSTTNNHRKGSSDTPKFPQSFFSIAQNWFKILRSKIGLWSFFGAIFCTFDLKKDFFLVFLVNFLQKLLFNLPILLRLPNLLKL